jgi:hypothetical protein
MAAMMMTGIRTEVMAAGIFFGFLAVRGQTGFCLITWAGLPPDWQQRHHQKKAKRQKLHLALHVFLF